MDGLIIDSEPFWREAEIYVFGTVGITLTDDDCRQTTGFRFDEVVEHWFHRKPWSNKTKQQVHDEVIDYMENAISNHAVAMPGINESIEYFKAKELKMAIASSSAMRLIKATVNRLKIEQHFNLLVSAEHEVYGKPHPAVFLRTAETLGIRPENCLVLEDSFNGVLAAKSARMKCVAIPEQGKFNDPRFVIADYTFVNLNEMVKAGLEL